MGNYTVTDQWAAQERLRAIERAAYWRGFVQRRELQELFGISLAQASADFQKYQGLNPAALVYQTRNKRYESVPAMECVLGKPSLREALASFVPGGGRVLSTRLQERNDAAGSPGAGGSPAVVSDQLSVVALPVRHSDSQVERSHRMMPRSLERMKSIRSAMWGDSGAVCSSFSRAWEVFSFVRKIVL